MRFKSFRMNDVKNLSLLSYIPTDGIRHKLETCLFLLSRFMLCCLKLLQGIEKSAHRFWFIMQFKAMVMLRSILAQIVNLLNFIRMCSVKQLDWNFHLDELVHYTERTVYF